MEAEGIAAKSNCLVFLICGREKGGGEGAGTVYKTESEGSIELGQKRRENIIIIDKDGGRLGHKGSAGQSWIERRAE